MFDFFRDLYLETHGIDSEKAETERKLKAQRKRREYIIFSGRTKAVIIIMAIALIVIQTVQAAAILERGIVFLLTDIFLCLLALTAVILLLIRKRKTEIAAAVVIGVFAVCEYAYMLSFFLLD